MLNHPTLEKLYQLRLHGMAKAFREQMEQPEADGLPFTDRLALLVDREATERESRHLKIRLRHARLQLNACVEDIDYRSPRGLDKALLLRLAGCDWIRHHNNVLIVGPTGTGKTYLACALGQKACRDGFNVVYRRAPRLFNEIEQAKGEGRHLKFLARARQDRPAHHRRLGPCPPGRRPAPRPAGNHGRPAHQPFHADHQPASGRKLARDDRRRYPGRRHPRPARSQRAQDQNEGGVHAETKGDNQRSIDRNQNLT